MFACSNLSTHFSTGQLALFKLTVFIDHTLADAMRHPSCELKEEYLQFAMNLSVIDNMKSVQTHINMQIVAKWGQKNSLFICEKEIPRSCNQITCSCVQWLWSAICPISADVSTFSCFLFTWMEIMNENITQLKALPIWRFVSELYKKRCCR